MFAQYKIIDELIYRDRNGEPVLECILECLPQIRVKDIQTLVFLACFTDNAELFDDCEMDYPYIKLEFQPFILKVDTLTLYYQCGDPDDVNIELVLFKQLEELGIDFNYYYDQISHWTALDEVLLSNLSMEKTHYLLNTYPTHVLTISYLIDKYGNKESIYTNLKYEDYGSIYGISGYENCNIPLLLTISEVLLELEGSLDNLSLVTHGQSHTKHLSETMLENIIMRCMLDDKANTYYMMSMTPEELNRVFKELTHYNRREFDDFIDNYSLPLVRYYYSNYGEDY